MPKVGIVVGSIRKNSFSEQLGKNIVELLPEGYEAEFIEIGNLPLYNQDSDEDIPAVYTTFRETVKALDAVVFVTPEHNRSVPAALKNALDVGSRPYGSNVWNGKPALIVSHSPSNLSGFGANHHLRQVLAFLNMPVVQQPEVYIANVHELLGEDGKITNQDTVGFLQSAVDALVGLVTKYEA
ncbi:NADPH-dependent FMN reductase [Paucisalibacillus globulus]|uniref:NADPH-dependent FMN reductase n=1 Tax=Paucisalibacillus globulus TaxID=351095 RepID=UPI0003F87639|nr:NAD(P)H-dependent oxidoreductase [Paucisalibacillus globulus]